MTHVITSDREYREITVFADDGIEVTEAVKIAKAKIEEDKREYSQSFDIEVVNYCKIKVIFERL